MIVTVKSKARLSIREIMKTVFEPSLSVNFSFHKNNPEINNAAVQRMKRISE